jgi:hypothetical protein
MMYYPPAVGKEDPESVSWGLTFFSPRKVQARQPEEVWDELN